MYDCSHDDFLLRDGVIDDVAAVQKLPRRSEMGTHRAQVWRRCQHFHLRENALCESFGGGGFVLGDEGDDAF